MFLEIVFCFRLQCPMRLSMDCFLSVNLCLQVLNLIKPVASVKKLLVTLNLAADMPVYAVGDEKRLMQIILNVSGNAVKFSREGSMSITAFVVKSESLREYRSAEFFPSPSDSHFYLCVQVCFLSVIFEYVLLGDLCSFSDNRFCG